MSNNKKPNWVKPLWNRESYFPMGVIAIDNNLASLIKAFKKKLKKRK